jgi:propionate CoA-transferase
MTSAALAKLCTADEAVGLIQNAVTVASSGFVGAAHPESLTAALERRFLRSQSPRDLTLIYAAGQGDGDSRGLNHLAHAGLLKRVIGGHWGLCPRLGQLALANRIEAYNFPQGVICQLFRDIAAHRPGCITHVGLGTFIDPINDGGRLNSRTVESLVERVRLGDETWLWYKSMPLHVAFIRASAADTNGGLIMDQESIVGEVLPIAQAVKNSGGLVIAQVSRLIDRPAPPHTVRVPGILVDRLVLSSGSDHDQTFGERMNVSYNTEKPYCDYQPAEFLNRADMLVSRRIIASRACDEIEDGDIVNLGIGMPEGVARIAAERGILNRCTLTVESGPIGGFPAGGLSFGASAFPEAIIDQPAQFDFYDGGGLDLAVLGAGQIDAQGNVNVSQFSDRFVGVGGFVNIAQSAKRLVFCGTLTAGSLDVEIQECRLRIMSEGSIHKFVKRVPQVSFSAQTARDKGQQVLYVTERAVFTLGAKGLELIEVAPGIDLDRHLFSQMDFKPEIRSTTCMRASCFITPPTVTKSK